MRRPYYSRIRQSRIDLGPTVLRDLYVVDGSTLFAAEVRNRHQSEWILSPVPPELWGRAFKLKVNLSGKEGTLGAAAGKLAELGVNIFTSTVSPVSAEGETSWSSVVELPEKTDPRVIETELVEFLKKIDGLSSKPEFCNGLRVIKLSPLGVLKSLASVVYDRKYSGVISDFSMSLGDFQDPDGNSMLKPVSSYLSIYPSNVPPFCLLAVDSAEKYARLTFPSRRVRLFDLEMLVRISSESRNFRGVFGSVVKALGEVDINIYSCENHMVHKRSISGHEEALFNFSADLSSFGGFDEHQRELTESKLFDLIKKSASEGGARRVDVPRKSFRLARREVFRPRCFLATNAVPGNREHDALVCSLLRLLRALDIDALNVDVTKSDTVRRDAETVLRSCPFMISLHLPSPSCKVAEEAKDRFLAESDTSYSPSDWVMFEEAFMAAMGRRVFRFVHKDVRVPRYAFGKISRRFDSSAALEKQLQQFELSVLRDFLDGSQYRKSLDECVDFVKNIDLNYLNRDLYSAHSFFDLDEAA